MIYVQVQVRDGLYKSIDGGNSWIRIGQGRVRAFDISPTQPNTIYAFSYYRDPDREGYYIQRSNDGGATWFIVSDNLTDLNATMWDIKSLVVSPIAPDTIYAAGHNGVYKSRDGGRSWEQTLLLENGSFQALVIDPENPDIIYAGALQAGMFRSLDGGDTWSEIGLDLTTRSVWTIAINPVNADTILVGTFGGGVFKSVNSGNSWQHSSHGLNSPVIRSLVIAPTDPLTIYAGIQNGNGIYRSRDGGTSWELINSGLVTTRPSYYISDLEVDPKNPTTIYAATLDGVFKSIDGGNTWAQSNSGLADITLTDLAIAPTATDTIYAAANVTFRGEQQVGGGVYKSTDGGNSWKRISLGLPNNTFHTVAVHPTQPEVVFAAGGQVLRSIDGGEHWVPIGGDGDTTRWMTGNTLAFDPLNPNVIYATGINRSNFKSMDGGNTWQRIGSATGDLDTLIVHPTIPGLVYAGANRGFSGYADTGIFRSLDGGKFWTQINYGLTDTAVTVMAFDPSTEVIYVGTGNGIFTYTEDLLPTPVATLKVLPDVLDIASGETHQFSVIAKDSGGNKIDVALSDVTWEIIGNIDSIDERGVFTAIHTGYGRIKVTLKTNTFIFDQSGSINVTPGPVATIRTYLW